MLRGLLIDKKTNILNKIGVAFAFYIPTFLLVCLIIILPRITNAEIFRLDSEDLSPFDYFSYNSYSCGYNDIKDSGPFSWIIRLYQTHISPIDGARCPMYPSCSHFVYQAVNNRGAVGIVMSFDRLLRCGRDLNDYPLIFKGMQGLYYDPVLKRSDCEINEYLQ